MNSTTLSLIQTHTKTSRDSKLECWLSTTAGEESVASTDPPSFQQQLPYTGPMQASVVDSDNIQFPDRDSLVFLLTRCSRK